MLKKNAVPSIFPEIYNELFAETLCSISVEGDKSNYDNDPSDQLDIIDGSMDVLDQTTVMQEPSINLLDGQSEALTSSRLKSRLVQKVSKTKYFAGNFKLDDKSNSNE
ncbi:Hypothetical protein CINCED_3A000460 [Cinara cedri]|uniref:Uncharacterized protein n=1 Tax=Cinara cedri TaxID=506608 RepID=A0A5E4NFC2_9HEMI|nr:Hypothetical protein CINCED_3A000460 [Cinara cedri]